MNTKKTSGAKIVTLISLLLIILVVIGLIVLNITRMNQTVTTETLFSFGEEYANSIVELSKSGSPTITRPLDKHGNLILVDIDPGEYKMKIIGTGKTGTVTVEDNTQSEPTVNIREQWNQLSATLWRDYKADIIFIAIGSAALLVLLHVLFKTIARGSKKNDGYAENPYQKAGIPVTNIPQQSMRCSVCHSEIPPGSNFCVHCGVAFANPGYQAQNPQENYAAQNNLPSHNADQTIM
ncbi:MAG: zinc ribbon domain-containing protein [Ruminococcaceae bacterium]|nr:zinc ribbon domain-containing protein [Oscillospiraceae bacterium]